MNPRPATVLAESLPAADDLLDLLQAAEGLVADTGGPVRGDADADAPLSFAQERLWMIEQIDPGLPVYNSPQAIRIAGDFDVDAFRRAVTEVLRRHHVLRSAIDVRD